MHFTCAVSLHILSLLTGLYDSQRCHRQKLADFHRGFPRVKPRFASNWLDFLFVNSELSGTICRAWTLKTTGARERECMKRNMHRNKKMHIFIHGNTAAEKNETGCGAALQGNCASNSRMRQKPEYFLRRIYLCQLTILTSISSLESRHTHSETYYFATDVVRRWTSLPRALSPEKRMCNLAQRSRINSETVKTIFKPKKLLIKKLLRILEIERGPHFSRHLETSYFFIFWAQQYISEKFTFIKLSSNEEKGISRTDVSKNLNIEIRL